MILLFYYGVGTCRYLAKHYVAPEAIQLLRRGRLTLSSPWVELVVVKERNLFIGWMVLNMNKDAEIASSRLIESCQAFLVTINAPLGHIPVYIRGGSVLPTPQAGMTTKERRSNPWGLIAATSLEGTASGQLYVVDGVSVSPNATLWVEVSHRPLS